MKRDKGLKIIEFADLGVTDYNAIFFVGNARSEHYDPLVIIAAIKQSLPFAPAYEDMPAEFALV